MEFVTTGISEEEKKRLLHCVVIGGGPTGVEFSGELSDFIMRDVRDRYTHVKDYVKVTLIEVILDFNEFKLVHHRRGTMYEVIIYYFSLTGK